MSKKSKAQTSVLSLSLDVKLKDATDDQLTEELRRRTSMTGGNQLNDLSRITLDMIELAKILGLPKDATLKDLVAHARSQTHTGP